MTREVPLTRGLVALVDDDDYERAASHRWYAHKSRYTFYARRETRDATGARRDIAMHMFLTGWPLTDHANGNGLDNRRANLRPATMAENAANRRRRFDNASGYKGVGADKGGWRARISKRNLGTFESPEEAARAYDAAAREAYGEFAWLNFPDNERVSS